MLWVNSIGMRMPSPGTTDLVVRRIWSKLRSLLRGLRRDESGMWVLSPFFVPRYTPRVLRLNGWLLRLQVGVARRVARIQSPSAWLTIPTATPAVHGTDWHQVVANRCDDYAAFPEIDREMVGRLQHDMLDVSDIALYVNHELQAREATRAKESVFLGHGVDIGHFSPPYGPEPEALRELPRPILGFYGALDDYRFDIDLFRGRRARPPRGHRGRVWTPGDGPHLVGGRTQRGLPRRDSLRRVAGSRLALRRRADAVAAQTSSSSRATPSSSRSIWRSGFPIASIDFPELAPYESLVHTAVDEASFLEAIDAALAEVGDERRVAARRAMVAADDWDVIAERCERLLGLSP